MFTRHTMLCLLFAGTSALAGPPRGHRAPERPDDRPGRPAEPSDGGTGSGVDTGDSVQVNVGPLGANIVGDAANEPSIAVDPTSPNRIAIGWRQFDTITSNFRQAGVSFSRDGGRTWAPLAILEPGVFRSDPVLAADNDGVMYYNSLQVPNGNFLCDVFRSLDGGQTWGAAVPAFGGDKAWMVVDRTAGPGAGNIYSAWSTNAACCGLDNFTRSIDGAAAFTAPAPIVNTPIFGTMAVGPAGQVAVAGATPGNINVFRVAVSFDANQPLSIPTFPQNVVVDMGGGMLIGTGPNPTGLLGQAHIAADPNTGALYLLATVNPSGVNDPADIHIVRSDDGGATWTPPVRVNDDPVGNDRWQWFGTMSVAPNGRVDVVWNDNRDSGTANLSRLNYAFSVDGAQTWSPNQVLSPQWDSFLGWPNQSKIGDYYHMESDDVGAHLAWAATFNGEQDVYYLRIGDYDCNGNGIGDADDLLSGAAEDCNDNGIPDACDLASGVSQDTCGFGMPEECYDPPCFNGMPAFGCTGDFNDDMVNDEPCRWYACVGDCECDAVDLTSPADMGGAFGACPPDGFVNVHDRNIALACFSAITTCEALYIDAGGAFGACALDGFCNVHDAQHALAAFAGVNTCSCGPAPVGPAPDVAGTTVLAVRGPARVRAGQTFEVSVHSVRALDALQAYQLELDTSGGRRGDLVLLDIRTAPQRSGWTPDYEAVNVAEGRMLAGLNTGGRPLPAGAALAAFVFRSGRDADGPFVIDLQIAAPNSTALVADFVRPIAVEAARPWVVVID